MTDPRSNSLDALDAELADDVDELLSDLGAIDGIFADTVAQTEAVPTVPAQPAPPPRERRAVPEPPSPPVAAAEPVLDETPAPPGSAPAPPQQPVAARPRGLVGVLAVLNAPVLRMSDRGRRTVGWIALLLTLAVAVIWFINFRSR